MLKTSASAKWAKLGPTWQKKLLLDATGDAEKGSRLEMRAKPFGIGCKACHAAGLSSRLANYQVNTASGLQKVNSAKHHKSPSHQSACAFSCLAVYQQVAWLARPLQQLLSLKSFLTMLKQGRPHVNLAGSPR